MITASSIEHLHSLEIAITIFDADSLSPSMFNSIGFLCVMDAAYKFFIASASLNFKKIRKKLHSFILKGKKGHEKKRSRS